MDKLFREFTKPREYVDKKTGEIKVFNQKFMFTTYDIVLERPEPMFAYLKKCLLEGTEYRGKTVSSLPHLELNSKKHASPLVKMAHIANYEGKGFRQHDIVQKYCLENDEHTLALEVPVFDAELSGFIDIIRLVNGKIQICDFKPKADKEKKAPTQLFHYRKLLSQHIGEPLSKFECVWFDNKNSYILTS